VQRRNGYGVRLTGVAYKAPLAPSVAVEVAWIKSEGRQQEKRWGTDEKEVDSNRERCSLLE